MMQSEVHKESSIYSFFGYDCKLPRLNSLVHKLPCCITLQFQKTPQLFNQKNNNKIDMHRMCKDFFTPSSNHNCYIITNI